MMDSGLGRRLWRAVFSGLMVYVVLLVPVSQAGDMTGKVEQKLDDSKSYRLGAGDVINVTVYGEDDLSLQKYRLPDSGVIRFPFGVVRALGVSLADLENQIADGFRGDYLLNPRVSVSIEEYRPFFISGQVKSPGAYPYVSGLTVRRAASIAGGLTERASESSIYIQRESDSRHKQERITLDAPVSPGDTVTVEESFF